MNLDTFAKMVGGSVVVVWLIGNVASFFLPGVSVPHGLNFAATAVVTFLFGGTALQKGRRNGGPSPSADPHGPGGHAGE